MAFLARVDAGNAFDTLFVFDLHSAQEYDRVPAAVRFVVYFLVALVTHEHEVLHAVAITWCVAAASWAEITERVDVGFLSDIDALLGHRGFPERFITASKLAPACSF